MKKISEEKLSQLIKLNREKLNYSQSYLETLTGINRQMIGRIEAGNHLPSLPQLNALLDVLEIQYEDILVEKDKEDVFVAFLGEATTKEEQEGFEKMVSMMLCYRKHLRLKEVHDDK